MLVTPRVGPVPMLRAALPAGPWTGQGPRPGDVLWLRLAGAPGGERQLLAQDGRPLQLGRLPAELANLPAGTPLAWTVVGTAPQLMLSLGSLDPARAAPPLPAAVPAEAPSPERGTAAETLRPDAQALRLQHAFSDEATRLALRWRQRALAGVDTPPDRRSPGRQAAATGRWPWSLLPLDGEPPPPPLPSPAADTPLPTLADAARWQFELTEGAQRLGLLLVEPDLLITSPPPHDNEPGSGHAPLMRALALRLLLTLPGLGLVVLQLQFTRGGTGLALRMAAGQAQALATLRRCLPAMASALARLDLALQHCQLDLNGPGLRPWSPAPRLLQAERLPPLLFRAATELVLCLWQASGVVQPASAARQPPAAQPKEPTMLTSRCSGISLYDSTCSPGAKSRA